MRISQNHKKLSVHERGQHITGIIPNEKSQLIL